MLIRRRLLLGAVGTIPLLRRARGEVAHRLTLLHFNDVHSRHEPVDARAMACTQGPACFGSTPRLAAAIREQRAAAEGDGRAVLLLDGGDQFQGSLFYTAHHGMAELAVQHAMGVDAMAIGNHEFDNGPQTLGRYIDTARFPVLSANIDASADPHLERRIRPWVMLDHRRTAGLPVGLVGLTTEETRTSSSPGDKVVIGDPRPALAAAVAALRARGARLVVLLSHLGLPIDRTLDGPAVIIGGHTHTLLSNDEPGAAGPHPTPGANGALVVQAGAYARYLGRLDLDVAADGTILAYGGWCRHIGLDLVPDPEVAAIVAGYAAPLEALRRQPVATLAEPLDIAACRIAPCRMGAMVADSLREAAHPPPGMPAVALMNAGGLRTGLAAGAVTLGQVLDALPFGNTLATGTITGEDLRAAVQHGLSMTGRGGFAQWSGLRMGLAGIEVREADQRWSPLDPARRYFLVTNNFIRTGGDGYAVLRDRTRNPYDAGPAVADIVADSLARGAP